MPLSAWTLLPESQISPPQVRVPMTLPILKVLEALAEGFAVRGGFLIAKDDDVAAEGILHIPAWIADARLPVEPGFAQQIAEEPRVDIAAVIMANVDDEALAIEDGVKIARPLIDVAGPHGLQVDIADVAVGVCVDLSAARVLPLGVAHAVHRRVR